MIIKYEALSDFSKVFIFPSSRKLYEQELPLIKEKLNIFLREFENIDSFYKIEYQCFIVIFISESTPMDIDQNNSLVELIIDLEKELKISLLDKVKVYFKQGAYVQVKEIDDFKKMIKNKSVSKKTIVFDNFIQSKVEFENFWETHAESSWIAHFF